MHQKVVATKLSRLSQRPSRLGRPNHPKELKLWLAKAACEPGISVAQLALEHGINANLLFKWRRYYLAGEFEASAKANLLPVTVLDETDSSMPEPVQCHRRCRQRPVPLQSKPAVQLTTPKAV